MNESEFIEGYGSLLIKQYYYKPKASAEAGLYAKSLYDSHQFIDEFEEQFDLDTAIGDRLDKIGKIVGTPRTVSFVVPKVRFGFASNGHAESFSGAPFFRKHENAYTSQQLDDENYRFFIRAKIAINNASAYMVNDEWSSISDVIDSAFNGAAYVVDNKNMSLTLYIDSSVPTQTVLIVKQLNLLPKPQGVKYSAVIKADPQQTFGFSNNPNAQGFSRKTDSHLGGEFATKVII